MQIWGGGGDGAKILAKDLSSVIAGKPRKEKKALLKVYETFIKNPNNQAAEGTLREAISTSKAVKDATKAGGGIFDDFNRTATTFSLENSLIRPIKNHNTFETLKKDALKDLKKTIEESPAIKIKINSDEIANQAIKETAKDSLKLAGRRLMYPVNKLVSMFIDKNSKKVLSEVVSLSKSEFGAAYYKKLIKARGLSSRAPKDIEISSKAARINIDNLISGNKYNCEGGFNLIDNSITFTREFNTLPRSLQANLLTHELKHFEQADQVIRREIWKNKENNAKKLLLVNMN